MVEKLVLKFSKNLAAGMLCVFYVAVCVYDTFVK